jgi:PAS domain S-box-containing protein
VFEGGIHPDDLPRVQEAISDCLDPNGDGRYDVEYRVIRACDGAIRHVATSGQMRFSEGRASEFVGAATDVTDARRAEASIRAREAQFRSFADHSSNLIWMSDPHEGTIIYRSAAYESIWGVDAGSAPMTIAKWIEDVHPDDRQQVEHAIAAVANGDVAQFEYRIVRPVDGTLRALRDTAFPILNEHGSVTRIGGITEDLTSDDSGQAYIVSTKATEARKLAAFVRAAGYRARTFQTASAFLEVASVLAPGCVLIDLRNGRDEALSVPRELKARSIFLPVVAIDAKSADIGAAVAAMKAGAVDYVIRSDEASLRTALGEASAKCRSVVAPSALDETASARIARLTPREHEVLLGLVDGGTNKSIGKKLGISPRTVELHRAQVMNRLDASSLTDLIQIALSAGLGRPSFAGRRNDKG